MKITILIPHLYREMWELKCGPVVILFIPHRLHHVCVCVCCCGRIDENTSSFFVLLLPKTSQATTINSIKSTIASHVQVSWKYWKWKIIIISDDDDGGGGTRWRVKLRWGREEANYILIWFMLYDCLHLSTYRTYIYDWMKWAFCICLQCFCFVFLIILV